MDIVERLRSPEVFITDGPMISPVAFEAADEIIKLREALERIADSSNWGEDGCWDADSYPDEIAKEALTGKE